MDWMDGTLQCNLGLVVYQDINTNELKDDYKQSFDQGLFAFEKYYDENQSVKQNCERLGIKEIRNMLPYEEYYYNSRAVYIVDDKTILLNQSQIRSLVELCEQHGCSISYEMIESKVISHELFHHLEETVIVPTDQLLLVDENDTVCNLIRDAGAHAFSQCITKGIWNELLDVWWLKKYYDEYFIQYINDAYLVFLKTNELSDDEMR